MDDLFLKTKNGNEPIAPEIVMKYNLQLGSKSPFTRQLIVDKNGLYPEEKIEKKINRNNATMQKPEEDPSENENVKFSTSEIIDLAHGEDSPGGQ